MLFGLDWRRNYQTEDVPPHQNFEGMASRMSHDCDPNGFIQVAGGRGQNGNFNQTHNTTCRVSVSHTRAAFGGERETGSDRVRGSELSRVSRLTYGLARLHFLMDLLLAANSTLPRTLAVEGQTFCTRLASSVGRFVREENCKAADYNHVGDENVSMSRNCWEIVENGQSIARSDNEDNDIDDQKSSF